jgi:DMSO/TMAO reductase YedYZ heme-binding membrane subunit
VRLPEGRVRSRWHRQGLAADLVAEQLLRSGAAGVCINVGGDLRVGGASPDPGGWRIDLDDPETGDRIGQVVLRDGGVATSSPLRRHWTGPDGRDVHHLVDPRTGTCARTALRSATVVAAAAWQAEVLTKAAILGELDVIERLGAAALVRGGCDHVTSGWSRCDPVCRNEEEPHDECSVWWCAITGLVAWALLAASVLLGLMLSTHLRPSGVGPAWVLDLHRFLGGLATVFVGVHIASVIADSYVHFNLVSVLVPFASSWKPGAIAWGVVGFWLLLAVEITSLLRRSLPAKLWRRVHVASLPLYAVASLHLLLAGTEGTTTIMRLVVLATSAAVLGLTGEHFARRSARHASANARSARGHLAPSRQAVPQHRP